MLRNIMDLFLKYYLQFAHNIHAQFDIFDVARYNQTERIC